MATTQVTHAVGSIVRARGREWVVTLAEGELLHLKPLSGGDGEAAAIHLGLEGDGVAPAQFPPPLAAESSDLLAGRLLRNAARLALRDGAAPFRSLGRLSVRPRPYQFVPLIMALRLEPARLLIADDVGIGKTVEAGLIASELLARGEARRLLVLCPPHLCEQWEVELREKFHLGAEIVRSGSIGRLERATPAGRSPYEYFRHLIVSIDFAKSDRNRPAFLDHCADLVIVDEAHTAGRPGGAGWAGQQQRFELVRTIAAGADRKLLLLTATPHSGLEGSFQSLLGLLKPAFLDYDLERLSEGQRRDLARHVVQRRRGDIDEKWLGGPGERRPFPERVPPFEANYRMGAEYDALFRDVLAFTRRTVTGTEMGAPRGRARFWAALSLLRSVMSSPAAAQAALENRVRGVQESEEEAEEGAWERAVLDPMAEGGVIDSQADAAAELEAAGMAAGGRARLQEFRRRAEKLAADGQDRKVAKAAELVAEWIGQGGRPIVFCRFIATADYVAEQLRERLTRKFPALRVAAVSGKTGGEEEREAALEALVDPENGGSPQRVLVATDCLSEGINLQERFDAVLHYDLPWNPNRLEQREGRVDRFGQPSPGVRAVVLYSEDNAIDGIVLDVLIRKARKIFQDLGISVPVPAESESVVKAVMRAVFEGGRGESPQQLRLELPEMDAVERFHENWQRNADREKSRRSRFAQHAIRPEEVAREVESADAVLGDPTAVREFLLNASQRLRFSLKAAKDHCVLDPAGLDGDLRKRLGWKKPVRVIFAGPAPKHLEDAVVLGRNHALIAALSERVLGRSFAPKTELDRSRCGAAYTDALAGRRVLALLRIRYRLRRHGQAERFAEEVVAAAAEPHGAGLRWEVSEAAELLHGAEAAGNISPAEREARVSQALAEVASDRAGLLGVAEARARGLEATYARLRGVVGGGATEVVAWPPDLLGVYVFLPRGDA